MSAFVRVAVNVPSVAGVFDYSLPAPLAEWVLPGCLVTVPFGNQTVQGVILQLLDEPSVKETKAVLDLLDPLAVLTAAQLALAEHMAEETLSPLAAIIDLMLPSGLSQQADVLYQIVDDGRQATDSGPVADRILNLLQTRGPLRGRQIDRHFGPQEWRSAARTLVRRGLLQTRSVLQPPRVRPKFVRVAQLAVSPEEAEAAVTDLGKTASTQKRREAALRFLVREPDAVNVSWVYAESGCNLADLQELEEGGLIRLFENEIWRDPLERVENRGVENSEVILTGEQEAALNKIMAALSSPAMSSPFLLQGVTASGKTEVYIRAAQEVVRRGRQAIVLVPEIALTPQTVRRFLARFPGQVGLIHSRLSEGERYDTWRRARAGLLKVVIGPRSALFAPLPNIGLIVADECHDGSYYQSEPPFYNAVTAAQAYARLCGAVCVMGSATPSVVQRHQAEIEKSVLLELPERVTESALPPVRIVDMREELKSGNRGIFSRALSESLAETLSAGEQAILFLNRRGTATYVFCRECGHVLKCPRCETPLTLHVGKLEGLQVESKLSNTQTLLCHRCGYTRGKPSKCPQCGSAQIREYGLGSEKVESEVQAMFPSARTLRWDWETTRRKDAHEIILSHFAAGRADVLVGTQMIAKGLDLPKVTLVGIVLADVGLNLPDPFAAERVFQVLTQVAGRAGRSARGGQVILQTFMPGHYAIQSASRHDVNGFHLEELAQRRRLRYPPFARLVRLERRERDAARAESEARKMADRLKSRIEAEGRRETEIIGPVPCFFAKVNGLSRWQVVLRGPNPASLLRGRVPDGWRIEADPDSLL
ncbi:MAG: primosomal protein N' [Chloroflexota bacterium]